MIGEVEVFFDCPYCNERVSVLVESQHGDQRYIEDCEVCCRPIELSYSVVDGEVELNSAHRTD